MSLGMRSLPLARIVRRPPLNRAEGGNCLSVLPLSNKKGNQRIWTILGIIIWIQSLWTGWTGAGSFAALFKVTKRWPAAAWTLAICRGENWARAPPPVRAAGRGRGSSSWKWGGCWEIKFYTMVERKRTTWEKSLLRRHAAPMKWNNKLDSSNKTNKSETWWPNQFNNLCNTSGAAHPISFLPILLSFVFKEYTAEHFSLSLPKLIFSCHYTPFPWL